MRVEYGAEAMKQFPTTLSIPFDFQDEEGRTFRVGYIERDHLKTLTLNRVLNGRSEVIRKCTLEEAREWYARVS